MKEAPPIPLINCVPNTYTMCQAVLSLSAAVVLVERETELIKVTNQGRNN